MVRVTEVVPDPDEPVIAMIGCWALIVCLGVREPEQRALPEQRGVERSVRDLVPDERLGTARERVGLVVAHEDGPGRPVQLTEDRLEAVAGPSAQPGLLATSSPACRSARSAGAVRDRPGRRLPGDGVGELVGVALREVQAIAGPTTSTCADLCGDGKTAGRPPARPRPAPRVARGRLDGETHRQPAQVSTVGRELGPSRSPARCQGVAHGRPVSPAR